jgi:hypothetical protein
MSSLKLSASSWWGSLTRSLEATSGSILHLASLKSLVVDTDLRIPLP